MRPEVKRSLDLCHIATPQAQLRFALGEGCWRHALRVGDGPHGGPLAQSDDTLVQSKEGRVVIPAYQELHLSEKPGAVQAMLVGQDGGVHFSAIFEIRAEHGREMPETFVKVDVAVRSSNPIGVIGASYVVHATERSLQFALESGACWAVHDDRFLATLERDPETPLNTVVEIEKSGRGLFRAMAKRRVTDDAKTQRLIYGWIVSDFRDRPASCAMLLPRGGVER